MLSAIEDRVKRGHIVKGKLFHMMFLRRANGEKFLLTQKVSEQKEKTTEISLLCLKLNFAGAKNLACNF